MGALCRQFHDALADFEHDESLVWRTRSPRPSELICHNDLGRYNTVYRDGHAVAFIDWDFCCPGDRLWDLAHVAWRWALMVRPGPDAPSLEERARRLSLLFIGYGLFDSRDILDVVDERQQWNLEQLGSASGAWLEQRDLTARDLQFLRANRGALRAALRDL